MPCIVQKSPRLTVRARVAYGVGNFASLTTGYGIGSLANFVFNLGLGVNPALVGMAQAIPRLVDLVTDPLTGHLSDTLRARWGRRVFVAAGAIVSAVFFAAIWLFPTGLSERGYFLWLLGFSCATYIGWSLLSVPWQALGFELTEDYHERTRLMAAATFFGGLAGIFYGWSYAATKLPWFDSTIEGARWVGGAMALSILISGCASALYVKERPVSEPAQSHTGGLRGFGEAAGRVLASGPFRIMGGAVALMCIGVFSVGSIGPYIAIYYIKAGNEVEAAVLIGAAATAWQGTSLLLAAPVSWVSARVGKNRALILFLAVALVGNCLKWVCYQADHPWLFVVPSICFAAGFTALWTLTTSMTADICDWEEHRTGLRDRGTFAGFYVWVIKLGSTLAFALGGVLINLTGFDVAKGTAQGAETLWRMRLVDFGLPTVCIAGAMLLLLLYPLTELKLQEMRGRLQKDESYGGTPT